MRVTIIADASFCPNTGAGGYGYWIAAERGKKGGGGPLKGQVESSHAAEMLAVCNAIHEALTSGLVQAGDHLLLQTDCLAAIDGFTGRRQRLGDQEREASRWLVKYRKEQSLTVSFRHVKGHTTRTEARYVTNNLCDQRAKDGMRTARRALKQRTTE